MEDAAFRRDRMAELSRQILVKTRAEEQQTRRLAAYAKAKAERDALGDELRSFYPEMAARLADVLDRIAANDARLKRLNTHELPRGSPQLLSAELVGRDLQGFVRGGVNVPSLIEEVTLPVFQFVSPYAWPLPRRNCLITS